jgi:hypothetical protein
LKGWLGSFPPGIFGKWNLGNWDQGPWVKEIGDGKGGEDGWKWRRDCTAGFAKGAGEVREGTCGKTKQV